MQTQSPKNYGLTNYNSPAKVRGPRKGGTMTPDWDHALAHGRMWEVQLALLSRKHAPDALKSIPDETLWKFLKGGGEKFRWKSPEDCVFEKSTRGWYEACQDIATEMRSRGYLVLRRKGPYYGEFQILRRDDIQGDYYDFR